MSLFGTYLKNDNILESENNIIVGYCFNEDGSKKTIELEETEYNAIMDSRENSDMGNLAQITYEDGSSKLIELTNEEIDIINGIHEEDDVVEVENENGDVFSITREEYDAIINIRNS